MPSPVYEGVSVRPLTLAMHSVKPQVEHFNVIQQNSYLVFTLDSKYIDLGNGFILYLTQSTTNSS